MSAPLHFIVAGKPVVWKRARRKGGQYFTDAKQSVYQKAIGWAAHNAGAKPVQGALTATMTFHVPLPSKVKGKAARAALEGQYAYDCVLDVDNLGKNILDALNKVAFDDDKQVCRIVAEKRWSANPHAEITIEVAA